VHTTLIAIASFAAVQAAPAQPQAGFKLLPVPARIVVTGYGEVKYMPDVATITFAVRGEGATSDDAVRAMTASAARIDAAAQAIDPAADPRTSEVRITTVRSTDCKDREYGPEQLSIGVCAISGYVATQLVTLRTLEVKDSGTLVGVLGRTGALNPRIENFGIRDSRPQQEQAITAALADAASKAAAMAAATHVHLGPILNVTSERRNDAQQIVVSGSRIGRVNALGAPPPPVPVSVVPEPLTTNSYVTVIYEIRQ
jgi:uncharacterized protein YggE